MPLIAFVNSYFFTAIFRKYMPKEEEQEHTDATPLLGEEDEEMKEAIRNLKGK
jgi:phosphate/sulfate permease